MHYVIFYDEVHDEVHDLRAQLEGPTAGRTLAEARVDAARARFGGLDMHGWHERHPGFGGGGRPVDGPRPSPHFKRAGHRARATYVHGAHVETEHCPDSMSIQSCRADHGRGMGARTRAAATPSRLTKLDLPKIEIRNRSETPPQCGLEPFCILRFSALLH